MTVLRYYVYPGHVYGVSARVFLILDRYICHRLVTYCTTLVKARLVAARLNAIEALPW